MIAAIMDILSFNTLSKVVETLWLEICFLLVFPVGVIFMNKVVLKQAPQAPPAPKGMSQTDSLRACEALQEHVLAGELEEAVKVWHAVKSSTVLGHDVLRAALRALAAVCPDTLLEDVTKHLQYHNVCNARSGAVVLDVLSNVENVSLMEDMHKALCGRLCVSRTPQIYEALLGGYASAGDLARVDELIEESRAAGHKLTARAHLVMVRGYLRQNLLEPALKEVQLMLGRGFELPHFAVTSLFKCSVEAGRGVEVYNLVHKGVVIPAKAAAHLFEECGKTGNVELATHLDGLVRALHGGKLPFPAHAGLMKVYILAVDTRALDLLQELKDDGIKVYDGFCIGTLLACAEARNLRFAEDFGKFLDHNRGEIPVSVYTALMKVYAHCDLFGKACDLFDEATGKGAVPDEVMRGCVLKYAFEAGRTEMLEKLCKDNPTGHSYTLLIRAAARDKDVDKAFALLERMTKEDTALVDSSAYNCVLDACICAGEVARAKTLMEKMRGIGSLNVVSFNIILKGVSSAGDMAGCEQVLQDIRSEGLQADGVSYNCVLNAATSAGNFDKAWATVDTMEKVGVNFDKYTVSILMKSLRYQGKPRDVHRTLELAKRANIDICSDAVLLSMTLETCVRHRELGALQHVVQSWEKSSLQPCSRTFASLIRAHGVLKNPDRCKELWQRLIVERGMEPDAGVMGCMLDALVTNGKVSEAVLLYDERKDLIGSNMIINSTLIKGFAVEGRAQEAMDMWRRIRADGSKMNTIVYNSLIDVMARKGDMDKVRELRQGMEEDGVEADAITFSTTVKGLCMQGDLDEAFEVFRAVQEAGLAECVVYNTILDACSRHYRMDLADKVLEDMEKNGIVPTHFTVGILVKMYGRRKELDKAFNVVATLTQKYKLPPNKQVQTCLMSACFCKGELERGFQVFEDIKKLGAGFIDSKTYGIMIYGCVRGNRIARAIELLEEAYGLLDGHRKISHKENISEDNIKCLMKALASSGQQDIGMTLLSRLRAAGAPVKTELLTNMWAKQ